VPNDIEAFQQCQPIYADFPGWKTPTHKVRDWKKLPANCRSYLRAIAELSSAKLSIVSVGPSRDQTIFL
jgi:adenylosuccinate synthase